MISENLKKVVLEQIKDEYQYSPVRGCAMQLLDIVGENSKMAQLVLEDISAGHTIQECEKKIKAFVEKNHKGNCGYCPPEKAHEIICSFFGLGDAAKNGEKATPKSSIIDLSQFL